MGISLGARLQQTESSLRPEQQRLFTIHDTDRVWIVEEGEMDLFAVKAADGEPDGAFYHLFRFIAGQAVLGMNPGPESDIALMAKPGPDAKVGFYSLARLREDALARSDGGEIPQLLEDWIENLSTLVGGKKIPKNYTALGPGEEFEAVEEARALVPQGRVIWVRHLAGASRFVGVPEMPLTSRSAFPVSKFGWIEAEIGAKVVGADLLETLRDDLRMEGLQHFHGRVIDCVLGRLKEADQREADRLRRKSQADLNAMESALLDLASPIGGTKDEVVVSQDILDTPLMRACQAIGKAIGVVMKPHPDMIRGARVKDPVASIARASGIRVRKIALKGEWWKGGGGPILVTKESDKSPLAILPNGPNKFSVYDPTERKTSRLTAAIASTLNPFGSMFYRPFPSKSLSVSDLLAFGLRGCRSEALTIILMGIASGVLAVVTPFATAIMFDSLIPGAQRRELVLTCGFLVVAAIASAMFNLARSFAVLRLEGKMDFSIQGAVWDRLLSLPVPFFRNFSSGDLATRSMGISQMRQILTGTTLTSILSGIFSIFSFFLLFYYSWNLALLGLALTLIACIITASVGYVQVGFQRQSRRQWGLISGMVLELITGIAKFRVAGAEKRAFVMWVREFAKQKKTDFAARRASNFLTVFNSVYPILSLAAIFLYNSYLMAGKTSTLSTGQFLAFTAAFTQFLTAVLALASAAIAALAIVPLYENAAPIFRSLPEVDAARSSPGDLSGAIEANHIVFRYKPDSPLVLRDISFSIEAGQYIAFVGPSGCGKSTLLRLILGFETAESGAMYFDGQDLSGLDVQAVRRQIGVVLQSGTLISGSIVDNIIGTSTLTIDHAWEAAKLSGLDEDIKRMPMGMYTFLNEGGGGLSGGQKQRLLIARAIVNKPRILLFDEATSALDNRTQAIVSNSLTALKSTRIVIAHRLSTIVDADRIFVMEKGRIVQSGNYNELMEEGGLFRELASRQLA